MPFINKAENGVVIKNDLLGCLALFSHIPEVAAAVKTFKQLEKQKGTQPIVEDEKLLDFLAALVSVLRKNNEPIHSSRSEQLRKYLLNLKFEQALTPEQTSGPKKKK